MTTHTVRIAALAALAGASLASAPSPVGAAQFQTPASGACRSALPVFEGQLRTRPLGVGNEGTANAFVTCNQHTEMAVIQYNWIFVTLTSRADVPVTVTCTSVDGFDFGLQNVFQTASTELQPGGRSFLHFRPIPPATTFTAPFANLSCNLPPGVSLGRIGQDDAG